MCKVDALCTQSDAMAMHQSLNDQSLTEQSLTDQSLTDGDSGQKREQAT